MSYILALDQGTTSSRAIVFDTAGCIAGLAQREFVQHYPQAGWVEHDPHEILDTQFAVAHAALAAAGIEGAALSALGITNQRETTVLWERSSGRAVAPALVWQDRRTAGLCDAVRATGAEHWLRERTGLLLDPYFSASKIRWLLDHDADLRARAERGELAFGTIDSWLIWHLTNGRVHVTDASNASRTMLMNIHTGEWDDELLDLWRVPRALLPQIRDSSGVCATTQHFGGDVPISGVAGDQQAALFGQACHAPGMAKCTYGTGCFLLLATGTLAPTSANGLLTTVAARLDGHLEYALEGSVFMGGATVQWLRDGLGIIATAADVEALAARVEDSDGVVLVPAFAGLGAPHWDAHARALLIGMTRGTSAAHIARAALDGIAWQVAEVLEAMVADSGLQLASLRVDGGACANDLLMQIQADCLGVELIRPRVRESTAFGAALLAGLGIGLYADKAAVAAAWHAERSFLPQLGQTTLAARRQRWTRAVDKARGWSG